MHVELSTDHFDVTCGTNFFAGTLCVVGAKRIISDKLKAAFIRTTYLKDGVNDINSEITLVTPQ